MSAMNQVSSINKFMTLMNILWYGGVAFFLLFVPTLFLIVLFTNQLNIEYHGITMTVENVSSHFLALLPIIGLALTIMGVILGIIFLFRQVVKNVQKGDVFIFKNVIHMRTIAGLFFIISILSTLLNFGVSLFLTTHVETIDKILSPTFDISYGLLFGSIMIFLIAEVFKYGIEIETDSKLSI